jgi:hypothetical protein
MRLTMHHYVSTGGAVSAAEPVRMDIAMFTSAQLHHAIQSAGLEVFHDPEGLMGRGLYIGRSPAPARVEGGPDEPHLLTNVVSSSNRTGAPPGRRPRLDAIQRSPPAVEPGWPGARRRAAGANPRSLQRSANRLPT